jgi:nucleoside-diphosphate-sugar epimerase
MSRHVVFGTGQIGRLVAEQLVNLGHDVVAVNRSGSADLPGAEVIGGDATDPEFTTGVAAGADVVYFCLNALNYARWPEEFPPLQRAVLTATQAAGARLVVLDNLYAYGPTHGRDLVETLPVRPSSGKAMTRAAMTAELLAAHRAGHVEVAIGRASDYFGPGATHSALGETVFATALTGRTAQVMGDPDLLHSYSYTPDVAAALITLGTRSGATGSVWHLPVAETRTTRQIVDQVYGLAGHRSRSFAAGRTTLRLFGLIKPAMREYLHTLYQFDQRWVVDDNKFRGAFGDSTTSLDDALATTLRWYRDAAQPFEMREGLLDGRARPLADGRQDSVDHRR